MKYFLIMNPGSKSGKSRESFEIIHKYFSDNKMDYDFKYTKYLNHAYELSRDANLKNYDIIVAVGGDGTVNRVVNGFYNENGYLISKSKLGIIHTGLSPDICKSYNIPLDINKALNTLKNGFYREINIGKIKFIDKVNFFVGSANIGVGPHIAEGANTGMRKIFGDSLGTFFSLIKELVKYKPKDITLNGETFKKVYNITIGKTFYIASGLKIKNDLNTRDERFFILKVQKNVLNTIYNLYSGKNVKLDYSSKIKAEGNALVEFDGDIGGNLPCEFTSAENLEVMCERD